MATKHSFSAGKLAVVCVADLRIDEGIQRRLTPTWIKRHVPIFDAKSIGKICVSRRADGGLYVIDGQHRTGLLRAVGYSDKSIEVELFEGMTRADEAALFKSRNDRRSVRAFDIFKSSVVAEDTSAAAIVSIVRSHGLSISDQKRDGTISAVKSLEFVFSGANVVGAPEGAKALDKTIGTIKAAWGSATAGFDGLIISGIGLVYLRYADLIDQKALATRLSSIAGGPSALRSNAKALSAMNGRQFPRNVAQLVVDLYNQRRRSGCIENWS